MQIGNLKFTFPCNFLPTEMPAVKNIPAALVAAQVKPFYNRRPCLSWQPAVWGIETK